MSLLLILNDMAKIRVHQVPIFGMSPDVGSHKPADRHDREVFCARIIQCSFDQLAGNALPLKLGRHSGLEKMDRILISPIA